MSAPSEHVAADLLAELAEGDLAPPRAAEIRAHLAGCLRCRQTLDDLEAVRAMLVGTARPAIPPEVSARMLAAIEREGQSRAAADEAAQSPVLPVGARRTSRWPALGTRLTAGLLGAAAVFGAGYLVVEGVSAGGSEDGLTESSAGRPPGEAAPADAEGGAAGAIAEPSPSGLAYSAATLSDDVRVLLGGQPLPSDEAADRQLSAGAPTTLGADSPVREGPLGRCIDAVQERAGARSAALAADLGSYEGDPAVVVVLDAADGTGQRQRDAVDVWVVDAACVRTSAPLASDGPDGLDILARATVQP